MTNAMNPTRVALFGASGGTGQAFIRAGAAQGLAIRASCRAAARARLPTMIEAIVGDLEDHDHIRDTIAGASAVCCVFGPRPPHTDVFCARATGLIVDAMRSAGAHRLVCQTGAMIGIDAPNWTLPVRLMVGMFRRQRPAVAEDRMSQERIVRESGLDWTLVKPPRLTDGPFTGHTAAGADRRIGLSSRISRADLAAFLVAECIAPRFVRQTIYITG